MVSGLLIGSWLTITLYRRDAGTFRWRGPGVQGGRHALPEYYGPDQYRLNSYAANLEQRRRVLEVLGTLTGYHTKQCTVNSRPAYTRQAYERYDRLIGYERPDIEPSMLCRVLHLGCIDAQLDHRTQHKYFFAINLYNSFDIIPDLFSVIFRVSAILGLHNVVISVYENGSSDQTQALLRLVETLGRSVGLRVVIRTSLRTRGQLHHHHEYLAEVRNAALAPLYELREATGEVFDSIVFMNDVLPCVDDLLELIWQSRSQNAGITCGADYVLLDEPASIVFVGTANTRDMNGTALASLPFEAVFRDPEASQRFQGHLPIQVQSCWNGLAILDPAPMYSRSHVRFRMARLYEGECSDSDVSLLSNDYWQAGYGRILLVPRVKLAYDKQVFDLIHPVRLNASHSPPHAQQSGSPDEGSYLEPVDVEWFGPHDRLFQGAESVPVNFKQAPPAVWCWGWDGANGDMHPEWQSLKTPAKDPTRVWRDRGFETAS